MTSEFYDDRWYNERWLSVPPVMRRMAADAIKKALDPSAVELIQRKHATYGRDWIHHLLDTTQEERDKMNALLPDPSDIEEFGWPETMSAHHGFGTEIRNLLRDEEYGAGIPDEALPDAPYEDGQTHRNWDDFYVAAVEAAVGLREV